MTGNLTSNLTQADYFKDTFTEEDARFVNPAVWRELLLSWGIHSIPAPTKFDDLELYKICKYVYKGAPAGSYDIISNSDGYYRLARVGEKVSLFDRIDNYRNDSAGNSLQSINGDKRNLDEHKHYMEGCRVLVRSWDDVEKIIPGISQSRCTYFNPQGCHECRWPDDSYNGNTCLLQLKTPNQYRYVRGGFILEFTLDQPVEAFYSYVGNGDMPIPLVVTASRVYIVEEGVYIDRAELQLALPNADLRNIGRQLGAYEIPNLLHKRFDTRTVVGGDLGIEKMRL